MAKHIKQQNDLKRKQLFAYGDTFQPNRLNKEFTVSDPYKVVCCDIHEVKKAFIGGKRHALKVFAAMDLCTGKIVAHYVDSVIIAREIAAQLRTVIDQAERLYGFDFELIIHMDRGTEFKSRAIASLADKQNVKLSMSAPNKPIDNAVIERWWRTANQLAPLWREILGHDRNNQHSTVLDAKESWKAFVLMYNERHKTKRNLYLGANAYEKAFFYAYSTDLTAAEFTQVVNKPANTLQRLALEQVTQYKTEVAAAFLELEQNEPQKFEAVMAMSEFSTTLNSIKETNKAIIQNQLQLASAIPKELKQVEDNVVDRLTNVILNKNNKVKHVPRPSRSPLTFEMQQVLHKKALNTASSAYVKRAALASLLQSALGCRVNEIRETSFGSLRKLLLTDRIQLFTSKTNILLEKTVSDEHKQIISEAFNDFETLCVRLNRTVNDDDFVFSNLNVNQNVLLSKKHFNASINDFLKEIENEWNEQFGTEEVLKSHSSRVNYCTELFEAEVHIDEIRQHMGHKDIRSTIVYNRYVYTIHKQKETLDRVRKKQKDPLKQTRK